MKIWLLPIEPFDHRYTKQWYVWWPDELRGQGFDVEVISGDFVGEMEGGEFLDPVKTWKWKGTQIARLAEEWKHIADGDVILTLDGWGPATTAVAYMRETTGKDVKLAAFFHAGSYDPKDFLARVGCRPWALDVERGWMKACDLILVGSDFHKRLIHNQLGIDDYRIVVVGLPIHQDELERFWTPWHERERLVVFPHRLAPEKNPQWWDHLQVLLKEKAKIVCEFATTAKDCETKEDYYKMLGKSKVAVSFADQETFGIAMQEAIALGCWAVAPNRLSYPELIDESNGYLFDDIFQAVDKVAYGLMKPNPPKWNQRHENAIARAGLVIKDRLGDGKI